MPRQQPSERSVSWSPQPEEPASPPRAPRNELVPEEHEKQSADARRASGAPVARRRAAARAPTTPVGSGAAGRPAFTAQKSVAPSIGRAARGGRRELPSKSGVYRTDTRRNARRSMKVWRKWRSDWKQPYANQSRPRPRRRRLRIRKLTSLKPQLQPVPRHTTILNGRWRVC